MSRFLLTLICTLTLLVSTASFAKPMGGSSDGGGTLCAVTGINGGRPTLLDFALFSPGFREEVATGSRLSSSAIADLVGFDVLDLSEDLSLRMAIEAVQNRERETGSEHSMALLEQALRSMTFYKTPSEIHRLLRIAIPTGSNCRTENLRTVVRYSDGSVNISIPEWNKLGRQSQAGLLIHEGLRQLQLLYQLGGSDFQLERLTPLILYGNPTSPIVLDGLSFFSKLSTKSVYDSACARVANFTAQHRAIISPDFVANGRQLCNQGPQDPNVQLAGTSSQLMYELLQLGRQSTDPQLLLTINSCMNAVQQIARLQNSGLNQNTYSLQDAQAKGRRSFDNEMMAITQFFLESNVRMDGRRKQQFQDNFKFERSDYLKRLQAE